MNALDNANQSLQVGNLDEASNLCVQAVEADPGNAKAYALWGKVCQAQINYEEALKHYVKASELAPDQAKYRYQIADILLLQGQYQQAETYYRPLLEGELSQNPWLFCNLGRSLLYQNKFDEASVYLHRAIELAPDLAEAHVSLGRVLTKQHRFAEATSYYQKAIELNPSNFLDYHELGDNYLLQKEYEAAIVAYKTAIDLHPSYFWSQHNIGKAFSKLERWEEAIDAYNQALQLDPNSEATRQALEQVLLKQELDREQIDEPTLDSVEQEIATLRSAIENHPNQSESLYESLGKALSLQHQLKEEKALIDRHPLPHKIFLPTSKIPIAQRVEGLRKVINIYENTWEEIYRPKLKELKDKFKGRQRAFVIGNGPSLNLTDLSLLNDEVTFGVNGIFLKAQETGFKPTFYLVEDHLVAEDRQDVINSLQGSIKLFPINIAYCINEGQDTIFFDHRPRKSAPHGFDFSTDASNHTYTGCTVTFTAIQLAYFLGFQEIYLIGVDCSYAIPDDVKVDQEYSVTTLDMQSDDINHFHPDYFGKGYRWHDPQVDKMKAAYQEARRVCNETNVNIYNATIGGKLEVFPRVDYYSLFGLNQVYPRTLIIDMTRLGSWSATGQIKQNLFANWSSGNLLQVYSRGNQELGLSTEAEFIPGKDESWDEEHLFSECKRFNPRVIYYRPVADKPHFHNFACRLIEEIGAPVVTHIMDDWMARLSDRNQQLYSDFDRSLRSLLDQSSGLLSIGDAMSAAFQERYGLDFVAIANCITPSDWNITQPNLQNPQKVDGCFTLRYVGGLADDMTFTSLCEVANAVSELSQEIPIKLEIYTSTVWKNKTVQALSQVSGVSVQDANFSPSEYREVLSTADALIIAYNFDEPSIRYIQYSMANKLPECLAAGVPLLAYGPSSVATIAYVIDAGVAQVVTQRNPEQLKSAILELVQNATLSTELGHKARQFAFEHHSSQKIRSQFYKILRDAGNRPDAQVKSLPRVTVPELLGSFSRTQQAHIDETDLVFEFFREDSTSSVMIDVGSHFGTALKDFAEIGWRIFAFEPDPSNREKLLARIQNNSRVTVDTRAVTNKAGDTIPFYVSQESTGVSTLRPFLDSHEATCVVTTTIAEISKEYNITQIDFLKIDTEGHDLMVLQGVPWEQLQPKVIECEFEDSKTVALGYTFHDLANYLLDRGYTVFVSEWHPIVRYGIRHDWNRLMKYPCELADFKAWGNLLAFKSDPGSQQIARLAKKVLRLASRSQLAVQSHIKTAQAFEKEGNFPQATIEFRRAIDLEPNRAETQYMLGELLLKQKQLSEAVECYQKALQFKPDYFWALRGLGDAYLSQGQLDRALDCFQQVIAINPNYYYAYHRQGNIFRKQGQIYKAITCYRKALEIKPDAEASLKALNDCLSTC
jgi:FkbM family methyltransferase